MRNYQEISQKFPRNTPERATVQLYASVELTLSSKERRLVIFELA